MALPLWAPLFAQEFALAVPPVGFTAVSPALLAAPVVTDVDRLSAPRSGRRRPSGADLGLERMLAARQEALAREAYERAQTERFVGLLGWLGAPPAFDQADTAQQELTRLNVVELDPVVPKFRGVEGYAERRLERTVERMYVEDLERRHLVERAPWVDEVFAKREAAIRPIEERVRFASTFPAYWRDHPRASIDPPTVVRGERIDLVRLGPITLTNEGRGRYQAADDGRDEEGALPLWTIEPAATAGALEWPESTRGHRSAGPGIFMLSDWLAVSAVGEVRYTTSGLTVKGMIETELVTERAWAFVPRLRFEVSAKPESAETKVALTFRLGRF